MIAERSGSHTLQQLLEIRRKLERAADDSFEEVNDCLKVLVQFPMTSELITESGLGDVVATWRDKLRRAGGQEEGANSANQILVNWKRIKKEAAAGNKKTSSSRTASAGKATATAAAATAAAEKKATEESILLDKVEKEKTAQFEKEKASLPSTRANIITIFANIFRPNIGPAKALQVSLQIEKAINNLTGFDRVPKEYVAKAKMLSASLKLNQSLREQVEGLQIDYNKLVTYSAAELASPELKVQREQLTEIAADSRRTDWLQKHEREIKEKLGIDPDNSWEYDAGDDQLSEPDAEPPDI